MKKLKELYDAMLHKKETEKADHPVITGQIDALGFQIYANSPLQFNLVYGKILEQDVDLKFAIYEDGHSKWLVVTAIEPQTKKEFRLDEDINRLTEEFPDCRHIREIVDCLLNCSPDHFQA